MVSPRITVRYIIGGLVLVGMALALWFILPVATDDERSVLTKMARSVPVTTCLAVKTVERSGHHPRWTDTDETSPRAPELERTQLQSSYRDVSLILDAESTIDNLLRFGCRDRASLSTPSFFGNLAFAQIKSRRQRETVALEKIGGRWEYVGRYIEPLNIITY